MRDRVRPPADLERVLDRLRDAKVFDTKQKGMMFAAALGKYLADSKLPEPQDVKHGEGIRMEYFERVRDDAYIDALAVAERQDLHILAAEMTDQRLAIFEQYAALGLEELDRVCSQGGDRALEAVLGLLDRVLQPQATQLPGLEGIDLSSII